MRESAHTLDPESGISLRDSRSHSPADGTAPPVPVEGLLHAFIKAAEDSERRYKEALSELDRWLRQFSVQAHAPDPAPGAADDALGQIRQQIGTLAKTPRHQEGLTEPAVSECQQLAEAAPPRPMSKPGWPNSPELESVATAVRPPASDDLERRFAELAQQFQSSLRNLSPEVATNVTTVRPDRAAARCQATLDQPMTNERVQPLDRRFIELTQSLKRIESHFARMDNVEGSLQRVAAYLDRSPIQMADVATKAAIEAVRLAYDRSVSSAAGQLNAINRSIVELSERGSAADVRTAGVLANIQRLLEELVGRVGRTQFQPCLEPIRVDEPALANSKDQKTSAKAEEENLVPQRTESDTFDRRSQMSSHDSAIEGNGRNWRPVTRAQRDQSPHAQSPVPVHDKNALASHVRIRRPEVQTPSESQGERAESAWLTVLLIAAVIMFLLSGGLFYSEWVDSQSKRTSASPSAAIEIPKATKATSDKPASTKTVYLR